jgi:tRNA nucleotidyltransferase/poly(A) polymerase
MPDYIYLLENRLSVDQRAALRLLRDAAREAEMILFLTGDAVRDLTSGHAVRDLEVAVYGNALKLKKPLEKVGAKVWGEDDAARTLYLCFPGTVRVDVVSTHRVEYKKPGQPTYHWASIQEDLRRRDFTVNAMAISLNEGSYGLLMDPLNGVADIEVRALRLVSNYGFLDDPALMIRATRYKVRLGWELEPRTQTRYENAKAEGVIEYLSAQERSRELEQIGHEVDGLRVLQAHEAEGWGKVLFPAWTPAKTDVEKLQALHDLSVELLMQGVHADTSAAQIQLLTAKLNPKDLAALKKLLLRPGFVEEWNNLDAIAVGFQKHLLAKENQQPSAAFKLFTTYDPEAVLWLGFTSKDKAVKERYNDFLKVWPEAKQKIPYALMLEMRIRAELPNYDEIVHQVFLQLIDGKLTTPEEMKAFLEPYSPPAPPPQVTIKRPRGRKAEKIKAIEEEEEEEPGEEGLDGDEDLDEMGDEEIEMPSVDLESEGEEEADEEEEAEEEAEDEPAPKRGKAAAVRETKKAPPARVAAAKSAPAKHAEHPPKAAEKAAEKTPAKADQAKATPAKAAPARTSHHPAKHAPAKAPVKAVPAAKHVPVKHAPAKAPVKAAPAAKHAPVKHAPAKAPAKAAAPAKKAAHPPAKKAPVKKAALKPHSRPTAHKSVPKVKPKPAAKTPVSKAKAAKPKPHAAAKAAPKKNGAKAGKRR